MPRRADKNDKEIYRVAVQIVYPTKFDSPLTAAQRVVYYGPYRTPGAANAMKTRARQLTLGQERDGVTKISWVEKTPVAWRAIP